MGCLETEVSKTPTVGKVPAQDEKKKTKRRRRGRAARRGAVSSVGTVVEDPRNPIENAVQKEATDRYDVLDQKEKLLEFMTKNKVSPFGVQAFINRYQRALRSVPSKLPPAVPANKRVKRVSWKDEESGGGADPAVLAMGPARKALQYSREQLLALKNSPHAKLLPEFTHEAFNTIRKRTESPNDEDRGARGDAPSDNHKGAGGGGFARGERRPADPRERVRKESEPSGGGIVLSPQRRSFTSGCGAPGVPAPPPALARTRPDSPLSTPAANKSEPVRRIGSGRILTRDITTVPWERSTGVPTEDLANERQAREAEAAAAAAFSSSSASQPYRPPNAQPRDRGDDRFERRSFGRDSFGTDLKRDRDRDERFGDKRDRDDNRRMNRFGGQRGRYDKDSEPEWFSGGPTSQLETIELRGFDEPSKSKTTNGNAKDSEKWGSGGRSPVTTNDRWRKEPTSAAAPPVSASPPPARSTPAPEATADEPQLANNDKDSGVEMKGGEEPPPAQEQVADFNLDDFLKSDSIPDFANGSVEPEGGSRFSRWFRRESPVGDHERLFNNIMDDMEGNNSEPQHMFAPISPAGAPGGAPQQAPPPPSLLELLQRANAASGTPHPPQHEVNAGGKMHSLEELEARLRGARAPPQHAAPPPPLHAHPRTPTHHHDNDLTAFKRLLAQVSGGHAVTANNEPQQVKPPPQQQQPPMSLLQMLNKSVEQQHKQQQAHQHVQQQQQPPHIPQELLYKLLQVQQSQQQQQQQHQQESGPGALPEHELLARPEASAIIRGLKHGEITSQHLIQQLGNPGLQSRHREMLLSILRQHNMHQQQQHQHHQMGGSPLPGSMGAPHLVVPPHHQPLRLSPLPPQTFCVSPIMPTSPNTLTVHQPGAPPAHLPSPHELSYRAQTIMQNALIKKKLEEARENYRRRHEPPTKQSISFTPTSVLRQMTADKDTESHNGGKPGPPSQWPQMPQKMPQGRPIVKGNHGSGGMNVSPQMGAFPSTPEFHSPPHYLSHQQMSGGMQQYPHQQQRQSQPPLMSRGGGVGGVGGGNTTLHQLLVQSHHRSINGQSQLDGGVGMGGDATSNQLARWFSPELLAQASAGKLPSVHVPNALSLEDLERNHHSTTVRN